jgi:hypothetical protein
VDRLDRFAAAVRYCEYVHAGACTFPSNKARANDCDVWSGGPDHGIAVCFPRLGCLVNKGGTVGTFYGYIRTTCP